MMRFNRFGTNLLIPIDSPASSSLLVSGFPRGGWLGGGEFSGEAPSATTPQ